MEVQGSPERSAISFIRDIIFRKATSHRSKFPGAPVVLAGDMNVDIQAMQDWMVTHSWESPAHSLVQNTGQLNSFWGYGMPPYDGWAGVSWIDHILLYSPSSVQGTAVSLGMGPLWATISDHRPITIWLTGQAFKISEIMDQRPKPLPPRITKLNFKDKDEATLALYRQKVREAVAGLPPLEDGSSKAAGDRLREYAAISVSSIPKVAPSQLKKKDYKGGWSPILTAINAKFTMVTSVVHKIRGIGKGAWWHSRAAQQAGITTQVNEWENKVRTLKWSGGIPPEA